MELLKPIDIKELWEAENITDKTKNNILTGGDFYRIYYSDQYFTSNGLFIIFSLKNVKIERYFNKIKCIFDKVKNIYGT